MGRELRPPRNDVLLAAAVALFGELEVWLNSGIHPKAAAAPAELVLGAALAWRRTHPLAATVAAAAAATAEAVAGVPLQNPLTPLIVSVVLIYSLVVYAPLDRALAGSAVMLAGVGLQTASQHKGIGNFLFATVFLCGAWVMGKTLRRRTAHAGALEQRTLALEQEREEQARRAVSEERARIARELHDVVAHSVSVMTVQASAVRRFLGTDQGRERETLLGVERTGRQALVEMRRLLGLLRDEDDELTLAPQPSLRHLDSLLEQIRDSGLPVELQIEGAQVDLPPGVDLSAYRIVQEALTNALKHAAAAQARVVVRYRPHDVELEIADDGRANGVGNGGGHGHVGMRERAALFGGHVEFGPRVSGGYAVRARLPLE